jgi:hypothetical protein
MPIPPRIEAANNLLYHLVKIKTGGESSMKQDLSDREEEAYTAAVDAMRLYIIGENDYVESGPEKAEDRHNTKPESLSAETK